jgi:hypothetical protein
MRVTRIHALVSAMTVIISAATVSTGRLIAQAIPTSEQILPTACGGGVQTRCGSETIKSCDEGTGFPDFNDMTRGKGYQFPKHGRCEIESMRELYKDK